MKRSKVCSVVNLVLMICMLLGCLQIPMSARSAEPEQTEGIVSTDLFHEHGDENTGCYGKVYRKCGGEIVYAYTRYNKQWYTCVKCGCYFNREDVPGTHHSGYYVNKMTCSENRIGIFFIEKFSDGKNVSLIAGLAARSEILDEYSFEWDEEGAYEMEGSSVLPLSSRGTFSVTLKYHDVRLDQWSEAVLSYTDYSVPVHLVFSDADILIEDKYLPYLSLPEKVKPPAKRGYVFKGYYAGDERYYDEDGEPADKGMQPLTGYEIVLQAKWEGVKCRFYYGDDADGDRMPDGSAEFTYGEVPPDIGLKTPGDRPGYIFDAYYIGDRKVYDADGRPVGIWDELPGDEALVLEERWIAKKYSLHYGDDADGDGVPDRKMILQYGDKLPKLDLPGEREGYVFDGYYYGERQIYDRNGNVTDTLPELFEGDGCILESVWHKKRYLLYYGEDKDGDGIPDGSISIEYGAEIPDIEPDVPAAPTGYVFDGYEINGIKVYDGDRRPAGYWRPALGEGTYTLKAGWKAMSFVVRYGGDEDGDGIPDKSVTFVYDSIPPEIEIPDAKGHNGYVFDGYYLGSRKVYDDEGQPLGIWRTVLSGGDHTLTERWRGVKLILRYGADPDGDGIPNGCAEIFFGDRLPELGLGEPAARRGQIFKGYYVGDVMLYDSKGYPQGSWLFTAVEQEYILTEKWEKRKYILRYGKDEDGDGIPDESVEVEYGEEVPELEMEVPAPRKGYVFEGYYAGGKLIYDAEGHPAGGWELDGEKAYVLEEKWRAKTYLVRYGTDDDGDGIPDKAFSATYAEEYPDVEVPVLKKDEVFDGYYMADEMVFDYEGRAVGEWLWDVDEPVLEMKSHTEKRKDAQQTAAGDDTESSGGDENSGEDASDENDEDESAEGEGNADGRDESVSGNTVSGNTAGGSASKTTVRKRTEAVVQAEEAVPEEPETETYQDDPEIVPQTEAEIPVSSIEDGPKPEAEAENSVSEPQQAVSRDVREENAATAVMPVLKKVAKAGAVTVGGIGCIFVIYAGLVYLFNMAEVDTIRPDGSRKRLCKLSIRSEKGKAFSIKITGEMRERCETDRLCLKLPMLFAMRYKDHTILIRSSGKMQEMRISREILVTI